MKNLISKSIICSNKVCRKRHTVTFQEGKPGQWGCTFCGTKNTYMAKKKSLDNHTIQFNFKGQPVKFTVEHNLGNMIENAVINWAARLLSYSQATVENFCQYVAGKSSTLICRPADPPKVKKGKK